MTSPIKNMLARVAVLALAAGLLARDGIDYPLPPADLKLHLELFTS